MKKLFVLTLGCLFLIGCSPKPADPPASTTPSSNSKEKAKTLQGQLPMEKA